VVRYDSAHGLAHRDLVEQNGSRKIYPAKALRRKVTLGVISTEGRNLS